MFATFWRCGETVIKKSGKGLFGLLDLFETTLLSTEPQQSHVVMSLGFCTSMLEVISSKLAHVAATHWSFPCALSLCYILCQSLAWKSLLYHCMLHVKAMLTHSLCFLFCHYSPPLYVLRSTPVIIVFAMATIIQICLGKLFYTPQNVLNLTVSPNALQWNKDKPSHYDQGLYAEFFNWIINSKNIKLSISLSLDANGN